MVGSYTSGDWMGDKYSASTISGDCLDTPAFVDSICPWNSCNCWAFEYSSSGNYSRAYRIYFCIEKKYKGGENI